MAEDVIETAREYILSRGRNSSSPQANPHDEKRKMVDSLGDLSYLSEVDEKYGPVHNILKAPDEVTVSNFQDPPIYLFIDVNFDSENENEDYLLGYQEDFKNLVESRIYSAASNNSRKGFDVCLQTLDLNAGLEHKNWKDICRKIELLTTGSRLFIFDKKVVTLDLNRVEKLQLSKGVSLNDLLLRLNEAQLPIETLGFFSNTFQSAVAIDPDLLEEFEKLVEKKTKVILLPASTKPMLHNLNFERAGVIESLVASYSIGGDHHNWIEYSQDKLAERIPFNNKIHTQRDVAISTTTFVSIVFDMPSSKARMAIPDEGRSIEKTTIHTIDECMDARNVRLDHELCGTLQGKMKDLMYRSLDYINDYFIDCSDKELRAVLFASVLSGHHEIGDMIENARIIQNKWANLQNPGMGNELIGKQTMTDRTGLVKEGVVLGRWLDLTQAWTTRRKGDKRRIKIIQILEIILKDEPEFGPEKALVKWNKEVENIINEKPDKGTGSEAIYGVFLLNKEVCSQIQALWRETKKVTHGPTVPANVIGQGEQWRKLYMDYDDKRYIDHNTANEIIKKLVVALDKGKWEDPLSTTSAECSIGEDLDWWSDLQ